MSKHLEFTPIDEQLVLAAAALLDLCRQRELSIVTAESCTGGLVAAVLTDAPGASDVVFGGFVTYANEAKSGLIGVPAELIAKHGAVSEPVARAMASGALEHSEADLSVAITGVAGPGGGGEEKPVGLVHLAAERRGGTVIHREMRYGDIGRGPIRSHSVMEAINLLKSVAAS